MGFTSAITGVVITALILFAAVLLFLSTIANSRFEYIAAVSGGGMLLGFLGLVVVVDHHLSRLK